jgi:radical SAM superfamily enzyme YgiQ (UPF0313 family)
MEFMMKVALLDVQSQKHGRINKDVMSGFGAGYGMGHSFVPWAVSRAKRRSVVLPELPFGYIASIFRNRRAQILVTENPDIEADIIFIHSSLVGSDQEREVASKIARRGKARVGFIGPLATAMPERFLDSGHFVIRGEPEAACLRAPDEWSPEGVIESQRLDDLDAIPLPGWEFFNVSRFRYSPSLTVRPIVPVLASRGCNFTCTYCPYRWYQGTWRARSTENVLDEIKYLVQRFHVRGIVFRDPLFTFDRERTLEIARGMLGANLDLRWVCETRLETLDRELLETMHRAGLRAINVGIESSSPESLKSAARNAMPFQRQRELVRICDRLHVRVTAFYVLGLPGDTRDSILHTIEHAIRLETHVAEFYVATPFPGSPLYNQVKDRLVTEDLTQYDGFTPVFRHDNLSCDELVRLRETAFTRYYLRPAYMANHIRRRLWR